MKLEKKDMGKPSKTAGSDFFERLWDKSWIYIKSVVDVVHEPVLILDKDLRVMAANDAFYQTFRVAAKGTEGTIIYELGNGQWNIPELKKLLEDIISKKIFFKGFQVAHEFPEIGRKVMILNGREIYVKDDVAPGSFPPIILLAMEDVTEMMVVAESLADHAKQIEASLMARAEKLETHIGKLEKEISELKKK